MTATPPQNTAEAGVHDRRSMRPTLRRGCQPSGYRTTTAGQPPSRARARDTLSSLTGNAVPSC